ncbi:hypothetical protein NPX79_01700 [Spiroplasma endosymbiont of Anurida maritima]|uniref:GHMP family kinase ATP-binding protein n=1 Tax=Spiroplasma endosymbiont of Anurida maritima TaxID=2967972 RepID=UPI0036D27086
MKIISNGKINLYIKLYKKTKNNIHDLKTLIIPYYDAFDTIEIIKNENFEYCSNNNDLLNNSTVLDAIKLFRDTFTDLDWNIRLFLNKQQPIGSGLGLSASNSVFTIKLLCQYFNIDYYSKKVLKIINQLGNDALFFLL